MMLTHAWDLLGLLLVLGVFFSLLLLYPLRRHPRLCLVLFPSMLLALILAYYQWGGYSLWKEHIHQQQAMQSVQEVLKSIKNPQDIINRLKASLSDDPKSAQGWYLLGRLYSAQNETNKAQAAFAKAYAFHPDKEEYIVEYVYSSWQLNQQVFTPKLRELLTDLLKKSPNQADALSMLAMDAYSNKEFEKAINYWQRLLNSVPEDSKEAQALRRAIARAYKNI